MSISSISSSQSFQAQMSNVSKSSSLSSDKQAFIEDLLSQYDSSTLSSSDAKEIVQALQGAGIEPSKAMESAMSASGFDAKEIGNLAGVGKSGGGRPMGPPPPPPEEESSSISELLKSLLETEDDTTTTSSTSDSSTSISSSSSSFDTILDYTSKILSLKDSAKTEVMDLLTKYSSDENTRSQEDTQKLIVNSLSQILKESDNYNTISFYA
jgi:hypothetical protein